MLKKQGGLAVAAFVASTEDNRQLMDRAAEAQRQLAAGLHVGVEEILISAIMSAQPQGVQPHMQSTKVRIGPNADFIVIECHVRPASSIHFPATVHKCRMGTGKRFAFAVAVVPDRCEPSACAS